MQSIVIKSISKDIDLNVKYCVNIEITYDIDKPHRDRERTKIQTNKNAQIERHGAALFPVHSIENGYAYHLYFYSNNFVKIVLDKLKIEGSKMNKLQKKLIIDKIKEYEKKEWWSKQCSKIKDEWISYLVAALIGTIIGATLGSVITWIILRNLP